MKLINWSLWDKAVLLRSWQCFENCAEALRNLCERKKILVICGVSVIYLVTISLLASRKLLWNDELFTYYIAQAPTLSGIWAALLTGADQNPFPFYVLTRWSLALFGNHEWALRVPEIVGVWVAGLCVFSIVSRQTEALYGFVAMFFLFITGANLYSFEARPYGLVLGFSSLAWLFWQHATQERLRKVTIPGMGASLAAAICSHYYAVFVFFPFGLGEFVRSVERRRVDWPIWLAMLGALSPLLLLSPLIAQAKNYSQGFWARPSLHSISETYVLLLMPAPLWIFVALLLIGIFFLIPLIEVRSLIPPRLSRVKLHVFAITLGFIILPIIAVLATMVTTGAFTSRYALPAVLGFSVLVAVVFWRLFQRYAFVGVVLLLLLFAGFAMLFVRNLHNATDMSLNEVYQLIKREPITNLPVVVSDAHSFMMLSQYAPHELSSRLVYLADPTASLRYIGYDTVDRGILDLKKWFGFHIEKYPQYLETQSSFFVYVNGEHTDELNWLFYGLLSASYHIELRNKVNHHLLYLVTSKTPVDKGELGCLQPS